MQNITGKRIRLARHIKNLTQEELATKLQIIGVPHSRNTIAKIESGFRQVLDVEIMAFAQVLELPIGWFFEEDWDADSKNLFP
ncbi:MAG: helix-turn-helix domain-containing protein [Phototrophicaceae bacterium]